MEKQKLLYQQARLHRRGASEMVLQTISASRGKERETSRSGGDLDRLNVCVCRAGGQVGDLQCCGAQGPGLRTKDLSHLPCFLLETKTELRANATRVIIDSMMGSD